MVWGVGYVEARFGTRDALIALLLGESCGEYGALRTPDSQFPDSRTPIPHATRGTDTGIYNSHPFEFHLGIYNSIGIMYIKFPMINKIQVRPCNTDPDSFVFLN